MDLKGHGWEEEVGTHNEETIANFNRLVKFINESSDEVFINDFDSYLDRNATLNYLMMLYLIEGIDNTGKNMMLVTYNNGRTWYPCLYDLDSTWGTWTDGSLNKSYCFLPEQEIADHLDNNLIKRMIKCMPDEISNRWFRLRETIFSKQNILDEFDSFFTSIPKESYEKENKKWPNAPGYGKEQIEEFIDFRLKYIDNIMNKRYTIEWEKTRNMIIKCLSLKVYGTP